MLKRELVHPHEGGRASRVHDVRLAHRAQFLPVEVGHVAAALAFVPRLCPVLLLAAGRKEWPRTARARHGTAVAWDQAAHDGAAAPLRAALAFARAIEFDLQHLRARWVVPSNAYTVASVPLHKRRPARPCPAHQPSLHADCARVDPVGARPNPAVVYLEMPRERPPQRPKSLFQLH